MRFPKYLQYAISVTWILLLLAGCGAPEVTLTPVPATPTPGVEAIEVDAGGFSFHPIADYSVEVEEAQAKLISQDQKTRFVLEGRSSCEVKPLEDLIDAFVRMYGLGIKEYETDEPYSIVVAGQEGLAVDVNGKVYEDAPNVVEDTHVDTVADGYLVHLYLYEIWCYPDHPTFYTMDVHVTSGGDVELVDKQAVFKNLSQACVE